MTAELEDQQEKAKEEEKLDEKIEADDEKIQKEEDADELKKNGDKGKEDDKKTDGEEVIAVGEEDAEGTQEEEPNAVAPRRRTPRFWEKLFVKNKKHKESSEQDPEAGTELLAKEGSKIEIKGDEVKLEKNDTGTDVTVPIGDDNEANGEARNGKAKDEDVPEKYSKPYWRKVGLGLLVIVILLTIVTVVSILTSSGEKERGPMMEPLVVTDCGPVRGYLDNSIYVFKGIPYALPPVGEHRWKPPRTASSLEDCWTGTYQAVNSTPYCYQKPIPGMEMEMSEDCLHLDVITPSLSPPRPRAVVVYFPGDQPLLGYSGMDIKWRPSPKLSDEKDVTFVVVKYRIGVLGFMSSTALSEAVTPPVSGNYGIMDMIAALKWVQKNIRGFGGDPKKVTIFAHGGGATAAISLLSSKRAEGLFEKLWLSAPAARYHNLSLQEVSIENSPFLKKLDCYKAPCLYNKTAEEIVQATPSFWSADWTFDLPSSEDEPSPVITALDGIVLYETPYNIWKNGGINKVPVVIGSAAQETGYSNILPGLETWSWTDFTDYLTEKLGTISTNLTVAAIEYYIHNSSTPVQQFHSMVSDVRTICPIRRLTEALDAALTQGVFWYLIDYKTSSPIQLSKDSAKTTLSTHGLDVAAIFDILDEYVSPMTSSDRTFQKNMQDLFYSYVKYDVPSIRKESLMSNGYINIIGDQIQSRMTPYENCHIWDDDYIYEKYARVL